MRAIIIPPRHGEGDRDAQRRGGGGPVQGSAPPPSALWAATSPNRGGFSKAFDPSSVRRVGGEVGGDRLLPAVAVGEQFGLVVKQFLARLGGEFEVRPLDDR